MEPGINKVNEPPQPDRLDRVGGVVIGGDYQGLGIARSLGRRGFPVCVIDDEHSIARYSKHVQHFVRVKNLRDEQETVNTILDIGQRLKLQGWVLYPTRDETVAAFSLNRERLSKFFRVPTPAWDITEWAWDKRKSYELAQQLGIETPKIWYPLSTADLEKIDARFPLVIKPAIKEHFIYETKVKAWRADNRSELKSYFEKAAALVPPGETMIQDLIPGGSEQLFGYCAFFKNGSAVGSMVTQYKRQHPPLFGRSCTLVKTVDRPEVEALGNKFLKAMNYYGLVEMEFKLDPRDGQFKLIDVNARTWGYHALGAAAGVDFARMMFEDQIGEEVRPARARPGVSWIRLATDFPVGLFSVMKQPSSVWSYLKSITTFNVESVFSLKDPLPSLVETALIPYLAVTRGY